MILRQTLSIAVLPFTVTVLVPMWIARRLGYSPTLGADVLAIVTQAMGIAAAIVGLVLLVWSLRRFAVDGKGTLAPWDPPTRLVVRGPYRYVRNPMISGVLFILLGESLVLVSPHHLIWTIIFFVANAIWIPLHEEPALEASFGDAYRQYRANVPRVLPRVTPWDPPGRGDS